jgi:hypothetical protein
MLQKEMAVWARLKDANDAQSFTVNINSITKKLLKFEYGGEDIA